MILVQLALLVALALIAVSAVWSARTARRFPPVGEFVEANGTRIHFLVRGRRDSAPPLVFLHGASGNLLDQVRAFEGRLPPDRLALFLDRPGHGHSSRGPRANDTPAGQADTLAALLDALGLDRVIVVGHSFGGAIAASFALNHPDRTAGLVLVSAATHPWPGGKTSWYYALASKPVIGSLFAWTLVVPAGLRRLECAVNGVFAPQDVPESYIEDAAIPLAIRPPAILANARDVTSLYDYVEAVAPHYDRIATPTVILAGGDDRIVRTDWHSERIAAQIEGSRLVIVPGLGHKPDYVTPELVLGAIEAVSKGDPRGFDPVVPNVPVREPPLEPDEIEDGIETGPGTAEAAR